MAAEQAPYIGEMLIERYELRKKELLLIEFIHENPLFSALSYEEKELMGNQLALMTEYRETLEKRIKLAES